MNVFYFNFRHLFNLFSEFEFDVDQSNNDFTLEFHVFDEDTTSKDDLQGKVIVDLHNYEVNKWKIETLSISGGEAKEDGSATIDVEILLSESESSTEPSSEAVSEPFGTIDENSYTPKISSEYSLNNRWKLAIYSHAAYDLAKTDIISSSDRFIVLCYFNYLF
jgi:Ca2+-dependent lipid-binding protein